MPAPKPYAPPSIEPLGEVYDLTAGPLAPSGLVDGLADGGSADACRPLGEPWGDPCLFENHHGVIRRAG